MRCDSPMQIKASEASVLARAGRPDAFIRIRLARLRYLPRMLIHAPPQLHLLLDALLADSAGWAAQIYDDLLWAKNFRSETPLADGHDAFCKDIEAARQAPGQWVHWVRTIGDKACKALAACCRMKCWRREMDNDFKAGGMHAPPGTEAPDRVSGFLCYDCGAVLATSTAWSKHRHEQHGE